MRSNFCIEKSTFLILLIFSQSACKSNSSNTSSGISVTKHLYIVNNSPSVPVTLCTVNDDATLSNCIDSGLNEFSDASNITFNSTRTFAYIPHSVLPGVLSHCPVNSDGTFGTCTQVSTGITSPGGIAVNSTDTVLYVVNKAGNSISYCNLLSDGIITSCVDSGATLLDSPGGMLLSPDGNYVYIANSAGISVTLCSVALNGEFNSCTLLDSMFFDGPISLAINSEGTHMYIANKNTNSIRLCAINSGDGTFGICNDSGNSGIPIATPQGITLNEDNSLAFVSEGSNVYSCPVNSTTKLFGSCALAGSITGNASGLFYLEE